MFKLNKKIEYALISLSYMRLKAPGEITNVREISDKFHVPFDVTSRVLQQLVKGGVLKSEMGPSGGYQVVRDLTRLNLKDLMEMILGKLAVVKCMQGEKCEMESSCGFIGAATYLNGRILQFLGSLTVSEVIEGRTKKTPAFESPMASALNAMKSVEF
jgi:Rrf2 family protein